MMKEAGSFFVIAMLLLVGSYIYIASQGGNMFALHATSQALPAGDSIVGGPSLSAQKIDSILTNAGSPAVGTGTTFYQDSQQYGIDDSVSLAFFHHESSYGTAGAAIQTHNVGNIVCTPGYSCIGRFRSYPDWQSGITDWYRLISGPAYAGGGLTTVGEIIPKYAPSSDNNDESAYIAAVQSDVSNWRAAQLGLSGLAQGVSMHAFITARMEGIEDARLELVELVGSEDEASRLVIEQINKSDQEGRKPRAQ